MDLLQVLPYFFIIIMIVIIMILLKKNQSSGFRIISLEKKLNVERTALLDCNNKLKDCDGSYSKYSEEKGIGSFGIDRYTENPRTPEQCYKKNPFENSKKVELHNTTDDEVITYKSIREASRETKISRHRIIKSCDNGGSITHSIYFFKYSN